MLRGWLLAAVVALIAVPAAAAQDVPRGFVRHAESPYWTWFGPPDWIGTYSAYGLTLTSPSGLDVLDHGFSSVLCTSSPSEFFRQRRAQFRAGLTLRGAYVRNVSAVRPAGNGYFRQTMIFGGRLNSGTLMRGDLVFMYRVTSPPYCYGSTLSMYAPAARFATSIQTIRKIWKYTYYSGPGAGHPR
jgi:hypothetical protein